MSVGLERICRGPGSLAWTHSHCWVTLFFCQAMARMNLHQIFQIPKNILPDTTFSANRQISANHGFGFNLTAARFPGLQNSRLEFIGSKLSNFSVGF
jgi:hypothetical protein